ncbi:MAG TPA: NAD(P)H-dependent oxidoreductase subunit E [Gammaproteobacteria bacterium]|jgi:NADH-quinone oxidoreductase subunit E|nr:NAD(P)H-dependent oxidoreductase subunit E [Gammaproteobacteria bacterium]
MTRKDNKQESGLSAAICEHIDQWNLRYPPEQKRSGVFEALRVVQESNGGFLTPALMEAVANYLGMPHVAVYEIATFYSMFRLEPVGKHVIEVCTNISCSLNGAEEIVSHLKKRLGIDMNGTTPDGQFTLKEVECLGACVAPPVCQIGKQYYENLTPEKINGVLKVLEAGKDGE